MLRKKIVALGLAVALTTTATGCTFLGGRNVFCAGFGPVGSPAYEFCDMFTWIGVFMLVGLALREDLGSDRRKYVAAPMGD